MSVLLELKKDKKRVKIRQWNVAIAGGESLALDDTHEQPLPSPNLHMSMQDEQASKS